MLVLVKTWTYVTHTHAPFLHFDIYSANVCVCLLSKWLLELWFTLANTHLSFKIFPFFFANDRISFAVRFLLIHLILFLRFFRSSTKNNFERENVWVEERGRERDWGPLAVVFLRHLGFFYVKKLHKSQTGREY